MTDDSSEASDSPVSRRDALKGGLVAVASAIAPSVVSRTASAQQNLTSILLGDDWIIDEQGDGNGNEDLTLQHQPTGAEFRYDTSAGAWLPNQPIGTSSSIVPATSYFETVDANSVSTEEVNGTIRQGDSESVQSAVNRASSGDKIFLQPGTFNESVTVSTGSVTLQGAGEGTLINGGSSNGIDVSSDRVLIKELSVKTTGGGANGINITGNVCEFKSIWLTASNSHGINLGGTGSGARIISVWAESGQITGDDVRLAGSGSIVDDVIGTVNDVGTNNVVGDTL